MRRLALAFAAAAVPAAAPASAAVISYTAPAQAAPGGRVENTIAGFDASLGTLNSAGLSFEGTLSGTYRTLISTGDVEPATVAAYPVLSPSAGSAGTTYYIFGDALTLTPSYGFDETSGRRQISISFGTPLSGRVQTPSLEPEYTGQGDTIRYTLNAGADVVWGRSPGDYAEIRSGATFTGTATVTYDYTPAGGATRPRRACRSLPASPCWASGWPGWPRPGGAGTDAPEGGPKASSAHPRRGRWRRAAERRGVGSRRGG